MKSCPERDACREDSRQLSCWGQMELWASALEVDASEVDVAVGADGHLTTEVGHLETAVVVEGRRGVPFLALALLTVAAVLVAAVLVAAVLVVAVAHATSFRCAYHVLHLTMQGVST